MNDRIWWFGTSSWSERSWVGPFYTPGAKPVEFLHQYAQRYSAVEADNTYYRIPAEAVVQGWRDRTPSGFRMAAKFPKSVVHAGDGPRPSGDKAMAPEAVGRDAEKFLRVMRVLGDKAGPLLVQLPYFNRTHFRGEDEFLRRLDTFLSFLPSDFRYAVEVRNRQWLGEGLCSVLRAHSAAFCLSDHKYLPHPSEVMERVDVSTADFSYVRLVGDRDLINELTDSFDKEVIDQGDRISTLASSMESLTPGVKEVWAFANNHYAGHGPATIDRFSMELTGARPTRPIANDGEAPF